MKKILNYAAIALILLLGAVHVILTPLFYKTFDLSTLWFAGTGLAFVFLGIINISSIRSSDKTTRILCILCNAIAVIYGILVVIKLCKPHAYISLADLVLLLILSIIDLGPAKK